MGSAGEIPLLSSFFHLSDEAGDERAVLSMAVAFEFLVPNAERRPPSGGTVGARPVSETPSGGEFDWGGTSVKW